MVGKYQTTLAGGERLQMVNVGLSLPPSSGQFSIITPTLCPFVKTHGSATYLRSVTLGASCELEIPD
jgi:hypothetical protein